MEILNKPQQNEEIYNMGLECAYEQIDPNKFKAKSQEEEKIFLEGYKAGLAMQNGNNFSEENENIIRGSK